MESSQEYQLVFEGPGDESIRTLQQIKGVFVGELEFPVADVQNFLASAPITIKTASTSQELEQAMQALKRAGAKVLIVTPKQTVEESAPPQSSPEPKAEAHTEEDSEEAIFEMVLDGGNLLSVSNAPAQEKPKEPKVYSLSEEDAQDTALFSTELLAQNPSINPPVESSDSSLDFDGAPLMELTPTSDGTPQALNDTPPEPQTAKEPNPIGTISLSFDDSVTAAPHADQAGDPKPQPPAAAATEAFDLSISLEDDSSLTLPASPIYTGAPQSEEYAEEPNQPSLEPSTEHAASASDDLSASLLLSEQGPQLEASINAAPPQPPAAQFDTEAPQPKSPPPAPANHVTHALKEAPGAPPASMHEELKEKGTAQSRPSADALDNQQEIKKTSKKHSRRNLEILVPILIGSSILSVANWYYLDSMKVDNQNSPFAGQVKKSLDEIRKEDAPKAPEVSAPKSRLKEIVLASESESRAVNASLFVEIDQVTKVGITLQTPAPRDLSKEEIVSGVIKPPWLRKIENNEVRIRALTEKGNYQADGSAFAYIEYKGAQRRIPVQMKLGITIKPSDSSAELRYQFISAGTAPPPDMETLVFEQNGESYNIFASGTIHGAFSQETIASANSAAQASSAKSQ